MEWQVTHNCPQCGAGLLFHEKDQVLKCQYCKVNSVIRFWGPMRYVLPYKSPLEDLLFVPYWRINGTAFLISQGNLMTKILDTSRPAINCSALPLSLGFRPQAMSLSIHDPSTQRIVQHNICFEKVFEQVSKTLIQPPDDKKKDLCLIFISTVKSLVYQPFLGQGDVLTDAITGNIVKLGNNQNLLPSPIISDWNVGFEACLCPNCGWDLSVSSESLIGICENCNTIVDLINGNFESIDKGYLRGEGELFLPFWRIKCDIQGIVLSTYGEFVRYFNIPKVISSTLNQKGMYFWIPAFRVEPNTLLRLAKQFTIAQPELKGDLEMRRLKYLPVTLHHSKAEELIKVLVGSFGINLPNIGSIVKNLSVQINEKKLIFVPFLVTNSEFLYPSMNLAVLRKAIRK